MRATIAMFMLLAATTAQAQPQVPAPGDPMAARLSADRNADIEPGSYSAGDNNAFSLEPYGDKYLLRFDGSPEAFVLGVDRVTLGGRVLKYDTGVTALRVSVWGGLTLYTEREPGGLPATRTGDFTAPARAPVSEADLETALRDESAHLSYAQKVAVRFSAPAASDEARGQAFDALANIDAGIERMIAGAAGRTAFTKHVEAVKLVEGEHPGVSLTGRTLTVTLAAAQGAAGRPSSRAIAVAIGKLLAVQEAG